MAGFGMLRHNRPDSRAQAPPRPVPRHRPANPPTCRKAHPERCAGVTLSTRLENEPRSH